MTRAVPDAFESSLLTELRTHVAERSATAPLHSTGRRMVALAAAACVAGAVAAGAMSLRPEPAFAVELQSSGDVLVHARTLTDADGLEQALSREGITAEVTYRADVVVPTDLDNGSRSRDCSPVGITVNPADGGGFTFTLEAEYLAAHDGVLHLTTTGGETDEDWAGVSLTWGGLTC